MEHLASVVFETEDVMRFVSYDGKNYEVDFCGEPTADGDERARAVRQYYEEHREGWWERRSQLGRMTRDGIIADDFILGLMEFVALVDEAYAKFKAGPLGKSV